MNRELNLEPEVLERISNLPLLPVAVRILEVVRDKRAPVKNLADAIATDGLLAERLVRLASYSPGHSFRFTSVVAVINSLGVENVKSLALALSSFSLEPSEPGQERTAEGEIPISRRQLWDHSLKCAIVAGQLAVRAGIAMSQHVFTAGFLHDIGRVLLYRHWRDHFFAALAIAREKNIPAAEAETLALGRNHLEIGELWAYTNDLARLFRAAIGNHHNFAMIGEIHDEPSQIVAVVQMADLLCERDELGKGFAAPPASAHTLNSLGLQPKDWTEAMKYANREVECSREHFGFVDNTKKTPAQLLTMTARGGAETTSAPKDIGSVRTGKGRVIPFPARSALATDRALVRSQKLTILIVEDHGSLCDMLSLYLMRYGYHVRSANDGENALKILDNEAVHLVLLDLMLPRIDGFAVLREIRERQEEKHPYVIVVSAGASTKDRSRVLEMGANEYMPKPFHLMRLLDRIQNVEKYLLS